MRNIDGQLLKQMIISGANNLYNSYPEIDALNVFPVPDGDTGMNMNLTMSSGAKEVQNRNDENVYDIAFAFSKGLLMGARGNSGVITSQIFRGFAQSLEGKNIIKTKDLAEAFSNGTKVAYKAVMRPVEGTILTVIRESSTALTEKIKTTDLSIEKAFDYLLKEARASLKRTPELLPVLKEVGVVDSGGAGLIKILEGMYSAILGDVVEKSTATSVEEKGGPATLNVEGEEEYGYCTEFIMRLGPDSVKKPFVEKRFVSVLESHGNSLVVACIDDIVKVHIHTLNPGGILQYAQNFGEFVTLKIENMTEQHTHILEEKKNKDKEKEEEENRKNSLPLKDFAMVAISAGEGIDETFKELGVSNIVKGGQTMNPSIEDIAEAIKDSHAKNVFVFPNNANIIMAASQAADLLSDENINVYVVPTKTIPEGVVAASVFNPDADAEENFTEMKNAFNSVKSGSITYAIKDTDIDGVHVTKNHFMGILNKHIVVCKEDKFDCFYELIGRMVDEESIVVTIFLGEDIDEKYVDEINEKLSSQYPDAEFEIRHGNQPVYSFLIGVE